MLGFEQTALERRFQIYIGDHVLEFIVGFITLGFGVLDIFAQGIELGFLLIEFAGVTLQKWTKEKAHGRKSVGLVRLLVGGSLTATRRRSSIACLPDRTAEK